MTYSEDLKHLLIEIDNESFDENNIFPELRRDRVMKMLNDCKNQGFISHTSSKQNIVTGYMDGGFSLHPTTYVTMQGKQFVEGKDNTPAPSHQYNIGTVQGSHFGDHGTITNNYGASISEINSLIETITDPADKEEAVQLVEILDAKEPLKPGLLKKFDTLLGKYPQLASTVGKLLLSFATGFITPPLE